MARKFSNEWVAFSTRKSSLNDLLITRIDGEAGTFPIGCEDTAKEESIEVIQGIVQHNLI
jgi:hypothetical protein